MEREGRVWWCQRNGAGEVMYVYIYTLLVEDLLNKKIKQFKYNYVQFYC